MRVLFLLLASLTALAVAVGRQPQSDFLTELRWADGVAGVEELVAVPRPACCILHLADYHYVSLEALVTDMVDQNPDVSEADSGGA